MFKRRVLTDTILFALQATGRPVGDGYAPTDPYGWTDTPTAVGSQFIPYSVVLPMSVSEIKGPLLNADADLWVPYQITSFGSSRQQCEWIADDMRGVVAGLRHSSIVCDVGVVFKIAYVDLRAIGGVVRGGGDDPPVFGQTDTLSVLVSLEL